MKKPSITKIADSLGYEKVGKLYYDRMYVEGYECYSDQPFGVEQVYLTDGMYADPTGYTKEQVLAQYLEYITENPEEAL